MRAIGMILAGGNSNRMGDLTLKRAASAMPVGGCYRSIDFPLSNMSNSGIRKIAVVTQFNSRSLHDHLSSPKWWNLGQKQGGLFTFTPSQSHENSFWYRGTADSIYQNLTFLKRSNEPYVVIASGNAVYKMDYQDALNHHIDTEADITIVAKEMPQDVDVHDFGIMELDENGRLLEFEEKPLEPQSNIISTGIYIIQRVLLIKLLDTIIKEARYDFVKDIVIRYRKKLKVMAYKYDGYWQPVNSVRSYFDANMDFLRKDIREMFTKEFPYIETKPKDEPPAKYNPGSSAQDVIIGSGSIINGAIQHSVIFRRVFTGEQSFIKNSVIMEGCFVGNNCMVENVIMDKEVVLSDGKRLIGSPDNPMIVSKGTVV